MRALALTILCFSCWAAPHPLTPLTAGEIRDAVRIFRASGHAPGSARFHFIALEEPPKEAVLRQAATPRRAVAGNYHRGPQRAGGAGAGFATGKPAAGEDNPGAPGAPRGQGSGAGGR